MIEISYIPFPLSLFFPLHFYSYALWRCQGTSRTTDMVYMSLFLRKHLLMSANKTITWQRWLSGKHSSLHDVVRVLDLNMVYIYSSRIMEICGRFHLYMLNTNFFNLNRYVAGTCQKRKECWDKTRWRFWYIYEGPWAYHVTSLFKCMHAFFLYFTKILNFICGHKVI